MTKFLIHKFIPRDAKQNAKDRQRYGVLSGIVGILCNLLLCVHRAQNTADLASVAAAQSLRDGAADPCAAASRTTSGNGTRLESCAIEGEDAVVAVQAATQVPFAPWVVRQSRAGPIACD